MEVVVDGGVVGGVEMVNVDGWVVADEGRTGKDGCCKGDNIVI